MRALLLSPFQSCILFGFFLIAGLMNPVTAKVVFVAQSGDDSTGDSWSTAYQTIGNAFINAVTGDTLLVKSGTYTENLVTTVPLAILGGFEGTEGLDVGDLIVTGDFNTTIDGNRKGRVLEVHHDLILDNITLTKGTRTGAGVWVRGAAIELRNVVLYKNGLEENSAGGGRDLRRQIKDNFYRLHIRWK